MAVESLILAVNLGSASKKYALHRKNKLIADVHFEYADNSISCTIVSAKNSMQISNVISQLEESSSRLMSLLQEHGFIAQSDVVSAIGIRVVAPTSYFLVNRFLDEEAITMLESQRKKAPLHIGTTLAEIKELQKIFAGVPIYAVSDSAFHASKPDHAWNYGISLELADAYEIKRFGYHGISVESIVQKLAQDNLLEEKLVVCHLGSGSSVTAVLAGKSIDTTMGYSPLEGIIMSTRSGSIDIVAAHELKKQLKKTDAELEIMFNTTSGLQGISGLSSDIRELLQAEQDGHHRASLALTMYVYSVKKAIGQMASVLGGIDTLVFTGTIGARSAVMRERIIDNLEFLNLAVKPEANELVYEPGIPTKINPRTRQKNIFVITTDESYEIALRTREAIKNRI